MAWILVAVTLVCAAAGAPVEPLDTAPAGYRLDPPDLQTRNMPRDESGHALEVRLGLETHPSIAIAATNGAWDWSEAAGLSVDLHNGEARPVAVLLRVENWGADVYKHSVTRPVELPANTWTTVALRFAKAPAHFWGMRGVPALHELPYPADFDPSKIVAFRVALKDPSRPCTLALDRLRLLKAEELGDSEVPLPIVDRFGQYRHAEWPGKIHSEEELAQAARKEEAALKDHPALPGRDRFGGWAEGPQLEATGWFRTQKIDGKWWLVTPEGHLFFSLGMDCVATFDRTWVTGRDGLFEWLPDREADTPFKPFFSYQSQAHSWAEPINNEGWTFSFYCANLVRKYGEDWHARWRDLAYRRLAAWGFNTLGSWCDGDVMAHSPLPYIAILRSGEARPIEAGTGYWGKMKDVFDPAFAESTCKAVADSIGAHPANPLCIGYFADNELSWGDVPGHTLDSPPGQPCRRAFVEQLQARYAGLDALNEAWGTNAPDWDSLRAPQSPTDASRADFDAYVYAFSRRYFDSVAAAVKERAPNQLYFGCRFAGKPHPAAIRACADVADALSFNLYEPAVKAEDWTGDNDPGKPILIGEFHFGAVDRGLFHPGLVATADQQARAEAYKRYVRSVAALPNFVGCHWFQFIDEPLTGRCYDGENYNIGFVTVADTVHPELSAAAREVHNEIYRKRMASD